MICLGYFITHVQLIPGAKKGQIAIKRCREQELIAKKHLEKGGAASLFALDSPANNRRDGSEGLWEAF